MDGGAETHKQHSGHEPVERVQASSLPGDQKWTWDTLTPVTWTRISKVEGTRIKSSFIGLLLKVMFY